MRFSSKVIFRGMLIAYINIICILQIGIGLKAWILTTTLVILFPVSLPPIKKEGRKEGKLISKNLNLNLCLSDRSHIVTVKVVLGMFFNVLLMINYDFLEVILTAFNSLIKLIKCLLWSLSEGKLLAQPTGNLQM